MGGRGEQIGRKKRKCAGRFLGKKRKVTEKRAMKTLNMRKMCEKRGYFVKNMENFAKIYCQEM